MADTSSTLKELLSVIATLTNQVSQAQAQVTAAQASAAQAQKLAQAAYDAETAPVTPVPPAATLTPSEVTLSTTNLELGKVMEGSASFKNDSDKPVTLQALIVAFRGPGATHSGGPFTDGAPTLASQTVAAGATVSLKASRTFAATDPVGTWEAYATAQVDGTWKDGKSTNFTVKAATTTPDPGTPTTPTGKFVLGAGAWFLQPTWGGGSPWVSTSPDYKNWQTKSVWSDTFIKETSQWGCYRFMDWNLTNGSGITSWSQRRQPTDSGNYAQYIEGGQITATPGLAYELQFDLAKRANLKYIWVNLPMMADDDYIVQFAKLAKSNLPAGTTLIAEWSNEADGGWFAQSGQANSKGQALGLPGMNIYYQGAAYTTLRTIALKKALREAGVQHKVVRCTVGNTDPMKQSLTSIYASAKYNPTGEKFDALGMQMYYGQGPDGASYTLAQAKSDIDNNVTKGDGVNYLRKAATAAGIVDLYVYEMNYHGLVNSAKFAMSQAGADSLIYDIETVKKYFALACLYTDAGKSTNNANSGSFGLKEQLGGADSLRSKAVKDWIAKQ